MRKLITIILILVCSKSFAQVYQLMPQYGYQANRMVFDSTLQIPTTCGVPTLKSVQFTTRRAAIAFDSCNNRFYQYNPKTLAWSVVSGSGGSTDTTSLSNRINLKIDSLKRRRDSVFAYRNGSEVFQFKDSIGGGAASDTAKVVIAEVHNATGTTLLKGEVVYLFGANGNVASVKRANNKQDSTSSKTFGIVRRDIASGGTGFITTQGQIEKLNLGSYTEGDILWLDSIDGQFTKVKPTAPYHQVFLGVVERANNGNGLAYVKPQNGYELGELHNVSVNSEHNNSIFYYDSTNRLWKAKIIDSFSAPTLQRVLTRSSTLTTNNTITASNQFRINSNGNGTTRASFFNIDTNQINLNITSSTGLISKVNVVNGVTMSQEQTSVSTGNLSATTTNAKVEFINTSSVPFLRNYIQVDANGLSFLRGTISQVGYTFPLGQGTTGQVLKLSSASQLAWQNDSIGSTDTTSLSNRINTKLNITDTSVFTRKQLPAYSFLANGTNAAANGVATFFEDTSGTYTGTITWGNVAPTSLTATYRWVRIGRRVDLNITLVYANAGTNNQTLLLTMPSDAPTPAEPSGATGNSNYLYPVYSLVSTNLTTLSNVNTRGGIRKNSGGTGYEIFINFTGLAASTAYVTTTYWTN